MLEKYIPSKAEGPLKEKEIIEDEKGRKVRTHADVVPARRTLDQLSNGKREVNLKKF